VLLDHGTHLVYQLLDIAGMPASVSAWTGRLRHDRYEVEDTASLRFEYPGRLVTSSSRGPPGRARTHPLLGDAGAIDWTGGELRLERAGAVERLDYSASSRRRRYHRWFAGLFEGFVAASDRGDPARRRTLPRGHQAGGERRRACVRRRPDGTTVAIADGA